MCHLCSKSDMANYGIKVSNTLLMPGDGVHKMMLAHVWVIFPFQWCPCMLLKHVHMPALQAAYLDCVLQLVGRLQRTTPHGTGFIRRQYLT